MVLFNINLNYWSGKILALLLTSDICCMFPHVLGDGPGWILIVGRNAHIGTKAANSEHARIKASQRVDAGSKHNPKVTSQKKPGGIKIFYDINLIYIICIISIQT